MGKHKNKCPYAAGIAAHKGTEAISPTAKTGEINILFDIVKCVPEMRDYAPPVDRQLDALAGGGSAPSELVGASVPV